MRCLRCGKETQQEQAFCEDCLAFAKNYPVNPGVAVQLPDRNSHYEPKRQPKRRALSAEEQVAQLRRSVRSLAIAVVALSLVLGITAMLLLQSLNKPSTPMPGNLGRNYTAVITDDK